MRGKKGTKHADPTDPPRRRANRRRGHGTYENDRPPIVGTVGRTSGQVRLRVVQRTSRAILAAHVTRCTGAQAVVCPDEWRGYAQLTRVHHTVDHGHRVWAHDADGDGIREVHVNTCEKLWTMVRTFLRPFRGVHKMYLAAYVAICEVRINEKRITPQFIARLVRLHYV